MQDDLIISRRELLAILFRRRYGIFAILFSCLGAAAFAVYYLISPTYQSEAVLMIHTSFLTEPLRDGPPESDFEKLASFHTQRDVLKSERLAAEVVRRTKLGERRVIGRIERIEMAVGDVKRWLGGLLGIERWKKPWDPEGAAIAAVHDGIRTFALPDSKALRVTLRSKDPDEAVESLNALLDAHTAYYYDVIRARAIGAVTFLEKEFERSRADLQAAELLLFQFKQGDRVSVEALARAGARDKSGPSILGVTDSNKVQEEIKLYVLKLEEEFRMASQNPDNERRETVTADIRARIQRYLGALNSIPERELQLVRLKRQFDIAQDNYQLYQRNLAKARLVASGETDRIRLVDIFQRPVPKDNPVFPQKRLVLMLAAVLGVILALTWAFVSDYLDHTIRSGQDIQRFLGTRLIGSLPRIAQRRVDRASG